jgi:hypothetical protein
MVRVYATADGLLTALDRRAATSSARGRALGAPSASVM